MTQITDLRTLIPTLQTQPPRVIFFDAMGTLFGLKQSVGEVYTAIAKDYQVRVNAEQINQVFYSTFQAAPPLAFGPLPAIELAQKEFDWWQNLAKSVFATLGVLMDFQDFNAYFTDLYGHFMTPDPWWIYPDVFPLLDTCQTRHMPLSVISNFDSRLLKILELLDLAPYFQQIFLSSRCPTAKPDRHIFQHALEHYQIAPEQAWHIGDSQREDYLGAQAVGMQAFLLKR
jgi:putative hydrolase of the HAD superfamily